MSPITRLGKSGRRIGAYVEIALGVRDANALLLKQSPDLVKDLALDVMDAILGVRDPEPQLEFYRGLAEGHDQGVRGRHRQDALRIARRFAHQGERLIEVGIVRDAHRHFKADAITLVRPVDHLLGDDVLVWNQKLRAVTRLYRYVARAKRGDLTIGAAHLDHVARLDRLVQQQNDTAEQVRDGPL